ncbi:MAG: HAMP domain-containing sensor histidine kinase [Candidatus Limiplasma sp.]|nr:HAMP domain-containing sensor histidine kinase [Candidatus Limiplasma sp.]
MLKQLRRKLIIVYTLMTSLILALVTGVILHTAESQIHESAQPEFDNGVNAIIYKLYSERAVTQAWLAQSEVSAQQIIYIEDGDTPLSFRGAWLPATDRSILISRALNDPNDHLPERSSTSVMTIGETFTVQGDHGDHYFANVTDLPLAASTLRIVTMKDRSSEDIRVANLRKTAGIVIMTGALLLFLTGWIYSGHSMKPVEENHQSQIEFISIASHELKTPLAVIAASVEAIGNPGGNTLLDTVKRECVRMGHLIDDLLLLSRIDAHRWAIRKEPVDLDGVLIDCHEKFSPAAHAKNIRLALTLPEEPLPVIAGDDERLMQIVDALIDNAITYTPSGGEILISASTRAHQIDISVTDDGAGISDDHKARIFDRFYRAQSSHTDRNHAGLGLSIAQEIAHLHGGRICIADVKPHGSKFTLSLPF